MYIHGEPQLYSTVFYGGHKKVSATGTSNDNKPRFLENLLQQIYNKDK